MHNAHGDEKDKKARSSASPATLNWRAASDQAISLVDRLLREVLDWEIKSGQRKNKRGPKSLATLRSAVEGFTGDLISAQEGAGDGWVYRSTRTESFTGEAITFRTFDTMRKAFLALGCIDEVLGFRIPSKFGPPARQSSTRFCGKTRFLDVCEHEGIVANNLEQHFTPGLPEKPLQLRKASSRQGPHKISGRQIKFEKTTQTETLRGQVQRLNEFLDAIDIRGGVHRGYIRTFNNGDDPNFKWNMGGRLYSVGEASYQQQPREQRLQMTLNDEPVCEIDIRASHLTILHSVNGQLDRLDPDKDPYEISELPRDVVKTWIVNRLGNTKVPTKWSPEACSRYRKTKPGRQLGRDYPCKRVGDQIIKQYPLFGSEDLSPNWAGLQWRESEAVVHTMLALADRNIPSLSVHDSLVVPASKEKQARKALTNNYQECCGARPILKTETAEDCP